MNLFKKLIPFIKPHMKMLILGLIGMGVFTVLSLLPPLLIRRLANDVITPGNWGLLVPIVAAITIVPALYTLLRFGNTWIIQRTGYKFIRDIRMEHHHHPGYCHCAKLR